MTTAGERFTQWIDNTASDFADRFKGWFAGVLTWFLELFMDVMGKAASPFLKPFVEKMESYGNIPPELQPILDEIKNPTKQVSAIFAQSAGGALIGGAINKILDTVLLPLAYGMNQLTRNVIPDVTQSIAIWLRNQFTDKELNERLSWLGFNDNDIDRLKSLTEIRFDPTNAIRLWRRFNTQWGKYLDDLKQQGWNDERIEALKDATKEFPSLQDVINFYAKEAFEPDMIVRYGLGDEMPPYEGTLFEQLGVPSEVASMYWYAHWIHPAFREVTEMLHRGLITDEDVYQWYRVVEIPPYWRDKLTTLSWDLPNRIELRMMARYGLVDKSFLVEQLGMVGLHEEYRDVAADMMLAMGIRTDLSTRFSKGWLTPETVKSELEASGLSAAVQERMYQWIIQNTGGDRIQSETNLTKSEIYTGVKKGVISWGEGIELLQDHNLTKEEAEFILQIRVGALEGSPDTYQEFKKITQLWRKSQGLEYKMPSEDLIQASKDVKETERILQQVQIGERTDITEAEAKTAVEEARQRYHQLTQSN